MRVHRYPLVYWQLSEELVVGRLLRFQLEAAANRLPKLRSTLAGELRRELEDDPGMAEPPLLEAKALTHVVRHRAAYREERGHFPLSTVTEIPIVGIYGENPYGGFTCFLPQLDTQFVFHREHQLTTLIDYFARHELARSTPEQTYRLLMAPRMQLDHIELKAPAEHLSEEHQPPELDTLGRLTEELPLPARLRKKLNVLPTVAWERGAEVQHVIDRLDGQRTNVLLVGEPSVGKSAVLLEAVRKLARRQQDQRRFFRTSAHRITAGARYLGDWQELCDQMAAELGAIRGVLWVTDIGNLLRVGGGSPQDSVASYWTRAIDRGELQLLGEMRPRELEAARALLPGFIDRFQLVDISELPRGSVHAVLEQFGEYAKTNLDIEIRPDALRMTHRLLERFVRYERFPGKAARFLADVLGDAETRERGHLAGAHMVEAFVSKTGLPPMLIDDAERLDAAAMRTWFEERIHGQPEAIEHVCQLVKIFKVGLSDPAKPIATMLFAGPTGVGKTATARSLADFFFGAGQRQSPLVRIDMSELQHPAQVERLIGATGGEPGELVRRIRERPFSVVLLDEVEKAHPVFFDLLLTVLDEGLLVDAYGRETDFRNAIIIMTSNLGSKAQPSIGFANRGGELESSVRSAIARFFRPELINRIDRTITFNSLGPEIVASIARRELALVADREGLQRRRLTLSYAADVEELICQSGFDPAYGARPLQRAIEHHVVGPLSRWLLEVPEVQDCTLELSVAQGRLRITQRK